MKDQKHTKDFQEMFDNLFTVKDSLIYIEDEFETICRQRDELIEALEKIVLIREEDCEKYVVKADQIACEALAKIKGEL